MLYQTVPNSAQPDGDDPSQSISDFNISKFHLTDRKVMCICGFQFNLGQEAMGFSNGLSKSGKEAAVLFLYW